MFNEFWKVYPRREDKKKARKAFDRMSVEKQLLAIEDCQTRYQGIEKCFIPLPTTYLNGERFEDDPIPRKQEKQKESTWSQSFKDYKPEF